MPEIMEKRRVTQESVPGKQVTLAHIIARPVDSLYNKIGLIDTGGALGILTVTPAQAAIPAGDVASKAANIRIGYVDRFNGSMVIVGEVMDVEAALRDVMKSLCDDMGYAPAPLTHT